MLTPPLTSLRTRASLDSVTDDSTRNISLSDRFTWITTIALEQIENRELGENKEETRCYRPGVSRLKLQTWRTRKTLMFQRAPAARAAANACAAPPALLSVGRPLVLGMEDYGDPTCEISEGSVSISVSSVVRGISVNSRTILKDLLSIELPSPKVREQHVFGAGDYEAGGPEHARYSRIPLDAGFMR